MSFNVEYEDMYQAYIDCRKRKKNKRGAKRFEVHALYNIVSLVDEINAGRYKLSPASCFVISYPTPREVFCASFRDRIVQHFVYNELNPIIEKLLIRDTASCRTGKGTDYAIDRLKTFVRRETNNYHDGAFYEKIDLSGFFMAIDRNLLLAKVMDVVETKYTGKYKAVIEYLLPIMVLSDVTIGAQRLCPKSAWDILPARKTLFGNTYGLPIGNITSQLFANFYLNDIDHFLKSRHKSVVRYVDDIVIVDRDKDKLKETRRLLADMLPNIHQKMNEHKTRIHYVKYGIRFLGIKVCPYYAVLAKSRINRLYYTTSNIHTAEQMLLSASSRKGMLKRYHGYRLNRRWYEHLPEEIKSKLIRLKDYKYAIRNATKQKGLMAL